MKNTATIREDKLRKKEKMFQAISASTNDAIIILDNEGKITYWNRAAKQIFNYSRENAIGRHLHELVIPLRLHEKFLKGFKEFQDTGQGPFIGKTFELTAIKKDGTEFPIEHSISAVKINGEWNAVGVIRDITKHKRAEEEIKRGMGKLRKALGGVIQALITTVETRDPYTAGHQLRVSNIARATAEEMDVSKEQIEGIRIAGAVHDIGKIHIPAEILSKPTRLTKDEFNIVKTHSQVGYEILKGIDFPCPVDKIVLQHHEKLNGTGYPSGLLNEDISMEARILSVADVVEAMASHRPYRPAIGIEKTIDEISENSGVLYDPNVVEACLAVIKKLPKLADGSPIFCNK